MSQSSPFDELEQMIQRLERQFGDAAGGMGQFGGAAEAPMDLLDRGDAFEVVVELPGYDNADVDVRVADQTLFVDAERETEMDASDEQFVRRERSTSATRRQISLPEPVEADAAEATMEGGILTIRLPKAMPDEDAQSIDVE